MLHSFKHHPTTRTDEIQDDNPSSSSSSSVVASNVDLLIQILSCLPVKSLLVFKSVSKQWLSLISDPYFFHKHTLRNHSLPIPGLFMPKPVESPFTFEFEFIFLDGNVNCGNVPSITLTFNKAPVHIDIQQSCNGLLYCRCYKLIDESDDEYEVYFCIYNPSTKCIKPLPPSPSSETCKFNIRNVTLAFDPLKSPHYQVVLVSDSFPNGHYQIEIYSSETNSWRVFGNSFPAHIDTWMYSGVFWNGSVHWISNSLTDSSNFYFDIKRDLINTMPMPPVPVGWNKRHIQYFGECGGSMYLSEFNIPSTACFDILEMDSDYTGWTVKYRVDLNGLTIAYPEMARGYIDMINYIFYHFDFSVLLVEEGEEKSSKLVLRIRDKLVSYDVNKKSFKEIHDLSPRFHGVDSRLPEEFRYAHNYIESLASL